MVSVNVYGIQKPAISKSARAKLIKKDAMSRFALFPHRNTQMTARLPVNDSIIDTEYKMVNNTITEKENSVGTYTGGSKVSKYSFVCEALSKGFVRLLFVIVE